MLQLVLLWRWPSRIFGVILVIIYFLFFSCSYDVASNILIACLNPCCSVFVWQPGTCHSHSMCCTGSPVYLSNVIHDYTSPRTLWSSDKLLLALSAPCETRLLALSAKALALFQSWIHCHLTVAWLSSPAYSDDARYRPNFLISHTVNTSCNWHI